MRVAHCMANQMGCPTVMTIRLTTLLLIGALLISGCTALPPDASQPRVPNGASRPAEAVVPFPSVVPPVMTESLEVPTEVSDLNGFTSEGILFGNAGKFAYIEVPKPDGWSIERHGDRAYIRPIDLNGNPYDDGMDARLAVLRGSPRDRSNPSTQVVGTIPMMINGAPKSVDLYETSGEGTKVVDAYVSLETTIVRISATTRERADSEILDRHNSLISVMMENISIGEAVITPDWVRQRIEFGESDGIRVTLPSSWTARSNTPETVDISGTGIAGNALPIEIRLVGDDPHAAQDYADGVRLGHTILGRWAVQSPAANVLLIKPDDDRIWQIILPANMSLEDHALVLAALLQGSVSRIAGPTPDGYPAPEPLPGVYPVAYP